MKTTSKITIQELPRNVNLLRFPMHLRSNRTACIRWIFRCLYSVCDLCRECWSQEWICFDFRHFQSQELRQSWLIRLTPIGSWRLLVWCPFFLQIICFVSFSWAKLFCMEQIQMQASQERPEIASCTHSRKDDASSMVVDSSRCRYAGRIWTWKRQEGLPYKYVS